MDYPQQSLDLAPAVFHPFPRLKSALKGRRFCDAMTSLRCDGRTEKALEKWLPGCFQHFYIRWEKCTVAQSEYFERNIA